MLKYKSHKTVEAAKIKAAERGGDGRLHLALEDAGTVRVSYDDAPRFRISEADLGYYVVYPDGYVSWSPSKAFEEGYTEVGAHEGLPVAGYQKQSDENVQLVNGFKEDEERILRKLDSLSDDAKTEAAGIIIDHRWMTIGRTQLEQAFMAINRSIFRPGRVKLPKRLELTPDEIDTILALRDGKAGVVPK